MAFGHKQKTGTTVFANFNAKEGRFVISHNEPGDGRVEYVSSTGRKSYQEKYPRFNDAFVRGIHLMQQQNYEDRNVMDDVIGVRLRDAHDGREYVIKFTMSSFAAKAMALINGADKTKPLDLITDVFEVGTEKTDLKTGEKSKRDKPEAFLIAMQDGKKITAKWSDDPDFKIPKVDFQEVKVGKTTKRVADPTLRDEYIMELAKKVQEEVKGAVDLQKAPPAYVEPAAGPAAQPNPAVDHHPQPQAGEGTELGLDDILGNDAGADDAEAFRSVA